MDRETGCEREAKRKRKRERGRERMETVEDGEHGQNRHYVFH